MKYAVITYMFGSYELLREPEAPSKDIEYLCLTDHDTLKSNTWKPVYLTGETSGMTPEQKCMLAKTTFINYTDADVVVSIDGSVKMKKYFKQLIDWFIGLDKDMGVCLHPERDSLMEELEVWKKDRKLDQKYIGTFVSHAEKEGFDVNTKGLIEGTFIIVKRNERTLAMYKKYNELMCNILNYGRPMQVWLTYTIEKYFIGKVSLAFFSGREPLYSEFMQLYEHGTNSIPRFVGKKDGFMFNGEKVSPYHFKMSDNKDLLMLIGTHVNFKCPVSSPSYCVISGNDAYKGNVWHKHARFPWKLDDKFYSEIYMIYWASKKMELPKYVGFCHYRRYFYFMDEIPDLDELFEKYDAITPKPVQIRLSVYKQYATSHNIEDLDIVGEILRYKYPDYVSTFESLKKVKTMFPFNMFIMKREDFIRYADFVMGVLDDYLKIVGTDIEKRIDNNKAKYLKRTPPNNKPEYQYRIGGYLGERLTSLFIMKNFKQVAGVHVITTGKKYKNEIVAK